jgi:hypothetical protein
MLRRPTEAAVGDEKNSAPISVAAPQFFQPSCSRFCLRPIANSTAPATKNRVPETKKGGIVRTATRVAKNVDPKSDRWRGTLERS